MWLLEYLKAPVLEHPSRVNVATSPKHYWNLHGSFGFEPNFPLIEDKLN